MTEPQPGIEEIPIPKGLAERLAPRQAAAQRAQDALNEAVEIALSAMGIEGENLRVEILPDPLRFRIHRS